MTERGRLPRALLFLYSGTIVSRLGTFVVPYLTLYLSQARGFTFAATGTVVSVGSLGLLVGNLVGGWSADRWSRKGTLLVALLVNAAGLAGLAGGERSHWACAACLFVALCGAGMYTPAANAVIADETDEVTRPFAYTVNYVCINVGMGLGPLLGGTLAHLGYGWLFVGDIATTLLCFVLVAFGLRSAPRRPGAPVVRGSPIAVWRGHPVAFAFCAVSFLLVAPLMGLEYAVPILVQSVFRAPLFFVGLVYSVNAACILALSFPIERWVRERDEAAMMVVAGACWAVGLTILLVGFSVGALLACTVVWTVGEIIASVVVPTYVSKRVPASAKARMLAATDAVRSLAGVTMPIALGAIWDASGVVAVLIALLLLPVLGTIAYLRRALRRRGPGESLVAQP
jgi:MFS family permease